MTTKILLIKTSSLGDLIHTFPALTALHAIRKDIEVTWVVEQALQDVPTWHPSVKKIIPCNIRKWRQSLFNPTTQQAIYAFIKSLRETPYDYIIDAQGLLKSAVLARLARGPRFGFAKDCIREPIASYFYNQNIVSEHNQHAITRLQQLFARAFGYNVPDELNYGITNKHFVEPPVIIPEKFLLLLHGTTWPTKHWPENYWQEIINYAHNANLPILLPHGNDAEAARAQTLAQIAPELVQILPRLSLNEIVTVIARAYGIISVDSGLGHLAAALAKPVIALFGPTDARRTGILGPKVNTLSANLPCAPCLEKICPLKTQGKTQPPCFTTIPPEKVWLTMHALWQNA